MNEAQKAHELAKQEVAVIKGALDLFRKPGGYNENIYFADQDGNEINQLGIYNKVASACAIGGVEHALFKTTHKVVSDYERDLLAKQTSPEMPDAPADHIIVYANVMRRVNTLAMDRHQEYNVEQITFNYDHREGRRKVIRIFEIALEAARKDARNAKSRAARAAA